MKSNNKTVVVTGIGAVTALGHDIETTFNNLCAGKNGIEIIPDLKEAGFPVYMGGTIKDLPNLLNKYRDAQKYSSRKLAYISKSLEDAMNMAGLNDFNNKKSGIFLGVETSRIDFNKSFDIFMKSARPDMKVDPIKFKKLCSSLISKDEIQNKFPDFLARYIANKYCIKGPSISTSNACASSNYALGRALSKLKSGAIDIAVTGSADEMIDNYIITGFSLLRALSDDNEHFDTTSRPFDMRRRGFVLGEGGAVLILETLEHAQKRGAHIICEFAGYGSTSDGHKITACHKEGIWLKRAMLKAIEQAGISVDDIDYINAHGTSTRLNDQAELKAILSLQKTSEKFGITNKKLCVNSTKSMIGHSVAAAGAIEASVTAMSISKGICHPTRNHEKPDANPNCESLIDFCSQKAIKKDIRAALSNSSGFSGGNTSLCFKKFK